MKAFENSIADDSGMDVGSSNSVDSRSRNPTDNNTESLGSGGDNRAVPDNGSHATFSVGGMPSVSKVDYPLPKDPHAPPGYNTDSNQAMVSDYGLNESKEVGFGGGIHEYGLSKGEAGQGAIDDSIAGQGFGSGAGGHTNANTKD